MTLGFLNLPAYCARAPRGELHPNPYPPAHADIIIPVPVPDQNGILFNPHTINHRFVAGRRVVVYYCLRALFDGSNMSMSSVSGFRPLRLAVMVLRASKKLFSDLALDSRMQRIERREQDELARSPPWTATILTAALTCACLTFRAPCLAMSRERRRTRVARVRRELSGRPEALHRLKRDRRGRRSPR